MRAPWALCLLYLCLCLVAGCAGPGGTGVWQGPGGGMEVNIYLHGPGGKYARWASGPGNELRFAGGVHAGQGEWTWQGVLTNEQVARIDAIVTDARWLERVPVGDGIDGDTWKITVAAPHRRNSFTVEGHEASVSAVWAVFNDAGRARFVADEDLVPKPDLDAYVRSQATELTKEEE